MTYTPKVHEMTEDGRVDKFHRRPNNAIILSDLLYDLLHEGNPLGGDDLLPADKDSRYVVAPGDEKVLEQMDISQIVATIKEAREKAVELVKLADDLGVLSQRLRKPLEGLI